MSNQSLIFKVSKKFINLSPLFYKYCLCLFTSTAVLSFLFSSCGRMPVAVSPEDTGAIEVKTCIQSTPNLPKTLAKLSTTCDSLIVEVTGPDIDTLRFSKIFDLPRPLHTDTLTRIPTGSNRQIKIYTIDHSGTIIHMDTISHRSIRIDPNTITSLNVVLLPAVGSIYLQLENIPTKVDSIIAKFTADDLRSWAVRAKRSTKTSLSLDKIPNALHGILSVTAIDSLKDTLYSATKEMVFNAGTMQTIALNFSSTPGGISLNIDVFLPGVTSAIGNMAAPDTSISETGDLLITEIMYAANDSEYVEVYNPKSFDQTFDSLYIDIDGTYRLFTNITIGTQKTFVFGRRLLPWCDIASTVASALDLSSTGNRITLRKKNGQIIDYVIFVGGANALEWPVVSGKQAIVLDETISDAASNNFGRNWRAATSLIPGTTNQSGSPRIR